MTRSPLARHFGRLVATRRGARGITQPGLADMLGTTQQAVSQWELGWRTPRFDQLIALMALLDITVSELVAGIEKGRAA